MASDFVDKLLADGHQVSVLTSRSSYTSGEMPSYDKRINMHFAKSRRNAGRLESWLGFWLQTLILLPILRWHRCIIMTDPPFLIFAGAIAKAIHPRRKLYWWTMDLYPEALIASNIFFFGKSLINKICSWLTNASITKLNGVICLGHTQKHLLMKYENWPKHDPTFAIVIPPWDFRQIVPTTEGAKQFKNDMGWGNKKIALYAGNLGEAHSYEYILRLAKESAAQDDNSWLFSFFCRGAKVPELKEKANNLPNVIVSDYLPEDKSELLLAAADLHIISMSDGWEGIVVPSKLYSVLNTTAPVLFIGPKMADTAIEINSLEIGWSVNNEDDVYQTMDKLKNMGTRLSVPIDTKTLDHMLIFVMNEA